MNCSILNVLIFYVEEIFLIYVLCEDLLEWKWDKWVFRGWIFVILGVGFRILFCFVVIFGMFVNVIDNIFGID